MESTFAACPEQKPSPFGGSLYSESGFSRDVACTALQAAGGVLRWTHLLQPEECTRRAAAAYREKCPVPGGEKRMTKLLHGNEKTSLNGGREPLFSQKELLVLQELM